MKILTDRTLWGKDFPAILAYLQAWNQIGERMVMVFPDQVIGMTPYKTREDAQQAAVRLTGAMAASQPRPKPEFVDLLRGVPPQPPLPLRVEMIPFFPDDGSVRVAWSGASLQLFDPRLTIAPVQKRFDARLGPDQALEIDCRDIFEHIQTTADFLKGFVVIESEMELDVVAVYTAGGTAGQVETLHSERVSPRRREVGKADLVPVPDPRPAVGFCKRDSQGRVVVTVKNQGTADAQASTTTVDFAPGGSFPLPTPAIPVGGCVDLPPLSIPAACFNPDCDFRITVDANNQINECNAGNNNASGTCLG